MKTYLIKYLVLYTLTFCICYPLQANDADSDAQVETNGRHNYLLLDCVVGDASGPLQGAWIEVYENNAMVKTYFANKQGEFSFRLKLNGAYRVLVKCKGYYPKCIRLDASCPSRKSVPTFYFFVALLSEEAHPYLLQNDILNLPVGIVAYSPKRHKFMSDKRYTRDMLALYQKARLIGTHSNGIASD